MAGLHEPAAIVPVALAVASMAVHYVMARKAGKMLFTYGLIISAAIAISTVSVTVAPAGPLAQASADIGILLAGALAFATGGWLLFAFRVAGDAGDD